MPTKALATFGCYRGPVIQERDVLAVADEFRRALCDHYHARHRALVDWRNATFPALWHALTEHEAAKFREWWAEKAIKQHHIEAGDRNAVSESLERQLTAAREAVHDWRQRVKEERKAQYDTEAVFRAWWHSLADWKNVKAIDKRRVLYASIEPPPDVASYQRLVDARNADAQAKAAAADKPAPRLWQPQILPDTIAAYCRLYIAHDLAERDLYRAFAPRLHPTIRAEIIEATQPKTTRTAPGMRYFYHRDPEPRPWEKLTVQFVGGLTFAELLAGESTAVRLEEMRRKGRGVFYRVSQQIGTAQAPCRVNYVLHLDRPFPTDAILQRWTMVVRPDGKREVMPIIKTAETKPTGTGLFAYRLSWTVRKEGVEVARFWGAHVNERLVLPNRLLALRMASKEAQAECDGKANALLAQRGVVPGAGERQGVERLADYAADYPADNGAVNLLHDCRRDLRRAQRTSERAIRCLVKIYETVTFRVCSRHAELHGHDIDLARIKRYETRDLLREDVLPERSRELLHACAPGKLKALLDSYGLASSKVAPPEPGDARGTDLFTTYVQSIRGRIGSKRAGKRHRSQNTPLAEAAQ